jgi:U1 small nuclear ribonucleoprotein A
LKKTLYLIFSAYGNIVEINCTSTYRMRGQAWIIFDQLNSATRAQRELQNFLFFGKPLRIAFAKSKSDTIARLDGTYTQRAKRKGPEDTTKPKKGQQPAKKQKTEGEKKKKVADAGAAAVAAPAAAPVAVAPSVTVHEPPPPPHRILFVEHLPAQANDLMLGMLFQQYPGFKEARVIAGKQVAFVEFEEVFQATTAMEALQGFKITATNLMKITFAKK